MRLPALLDDPSQCRREQQDSWLGVLCIQPASRPTVGTPGVWGRSQIGTAAELRLGMGVRQSRLPACGVSEPAVVMEEGEEAQKV